jgi:uncharacterized protein (AIM24 family)
MTRRNDEIDFAIIGSETSQAVQIELDPGETVVADPGSMVMMEPGIRMTTIFGDDDQGVLAKLWFAGSRVLSGESLFLTAFVNENKQGKHHVWFASDLPGPIVPFNLSQYGGRIICQKTAFLCAARGVLISATRPLPFTLFFGGNLIFQKLEGDGMAFIHGGGHVATVQLQHNQSMRFDPTCVLAFTADTVVKSERLQNLKNLLFADEGSQFMLFEGPGVVWFQTAPQSRVISTVLSKLRRRK